MGRSPLDWSRAFFQVGTITLVIVLAYLLLKIVSFMAGVVSILVIAALVAYVLQLAVDPLSRRMSRGLAVVLVVMAVLVIVALAAALLVPLVVTQAQDLVRSLPAVADRAQSAASLLEQKLAVRNIHLTFRFETLVLPRLEYFYNYLAGHIGALLASGFFSFFSAAMTLVCAVYLLKDGSQLWDDLAALLPASARPSYAYFRRELNRSLSNYFRGQIINAGVILVSSTIAFTILGMTYGVVGGLFWGLCEIIPMFGTYIGIGTCLLLAALQGGWVLLKVLLVAVAIQQIRDNIISPRVMSHTTGLHPVVIIAAVLTGLRVAGFLGILLAIPLAALAAATLKAYLELEKSGAAEGSDSAIAAVPDSASGEAGEGIQSSTPPP